MLSARGKRRQPATRRDSTGTICTRARVRKDQPADARQRSRQGKFSPRRASLPLDVIANSTARLWRRRGPKGRSSAASPSSCKDGWCRWASRSHMTGAPVQQTRDPKAVGARQDRLQKGSVCWSAPTIAVSFFKRVSLYVAGGAAATVCVLWVAGNAGWLRPFRLKYSLNVMTPRRSCDGICRRRQWSPTHPHTPARGRAKAQAVRFAVSIVGPACVRGARGGDAVVPGAESSRQSW